MKHQSDSIKPLHSTRRRALRWITRIAIMWSATSLMWISTTSVYAAGLDDEHYQRAKEIKLRAIEFLRSAQDEETGGWSVAPDRPVFPGVTALVLNGMLMEPNIDSSDASVVRGADFLLSYVQPDGGIYDRILSNYNTALALSALSKLNRPDATAAIAPAQAFLRGLQWSDQTLESGEQINRDHAFFGGAGYGSHGRPDNSNLQLMLEGLYDSGLDCNDPAFQRAVVFLQRTQMLDSVNDQSFADDSKQGGFIYAIGEDLAHQGEGESKAGVIEETLDDGTTVSRLRCYGSMTYAGFKSYLYAQLDRDDVRVQAAHQWIRRHYTLVENPGLGQQGYYYYLHTFARAMDAWGSSSITTINADGSEGETHDWANDLIDQLASLQNEDGSFSNDADRWMEGDPALVTAYMLNALQYTID